MEVSLLIAFGKRVKVEIHGVRVGAQEVGDLRGRAADLLADVKVVEALEDVLVVARYGVLLLDVVDGARPDDLEVADGVASRTLPRAHQVERDQNACLVGALLRMHQHSLKFT